MGDLQKSSDENLESNIIINEEHITSFVNDNSNYQRTASINNGFISNNSDIEISSNKKLINCNLEDSDKQKPFITIANDCQKPLISVEKNNCTNHLANKCDILVDINTTGVNNAPSNKIVPCDINETVIKPKSSLVSLDDSKNRLKKCLNERISNHSNHNRSSQLDNDQENEVDEVLQVSLCHFTGTLDINCT